MSLARIGKVTLRGGATLSVMPMKHSLTPHRYITDKRREAFVGYVADRYDDYIVNHGEAPEALVIVYGGIKQTARTSWLMQGDSEDSTTSTLSLALTALLRSIVL